MSNTNIPNNNNQPPQTGALFFYKVGDVDFSIDHPEVRVSEILRLAGYDPHKTILVAVKKDHEHDHLESDGIVNLLEYGVERFEVEKKQVEVSINGNPVMLYPGEYIVSTLKKMLHVPAAHILASLVNQHLQPLDDNSKVCIEGGEKFISYPCDGQAS